MKVLPHLNTITLDYILEFLILHEDKFISIEFIQKHILKDRSYQELELYLSYLYELPNSENILIAKKDKGRGDHQWRYSLKATYATKVFLEDEGGFSALADSYSKDKKQMEIKNDWEMKKLVHETRLSGWNFRNKWLGTLIGVAGIIAALLIALLTG